MLIHEKIYHDLFRQIATGSCHVGDQLPSEKELMEEYSCSLAPVRQAMSRLEQEGLIERMRGKGTFVKTNNPVDFKQDLVGFTGALYDERSEWTYKTSGVQVIAATGALAQTLEVDEGAQVVLVERIGWFKGEIIQFSRHYIPRTELFDAIRAEGDIQSWRFLLEGKLGIYIMESQDEVSAILAEGELEQYFPQRDGIPMPLLMLERTSRSRSRTVQEHTVFYISNFKAGGKTVKHKYIVRADRRAYTD